MNAFGNPSSPGSILKSSRESQGFSLEQISAQTKIHTKILDALERDDYAHLPARTFARGFLVTYAKTLGMDSQQMLLDFHEFLEAKFKERPSRSQGMEGYAFEPGENEQNKRGVIIAGVLGVVFVGLVLFFFKPANKKRGEKHKELAVETTTPTGVGANDIEAPPTLKEGNPSPAEVNDVKPQPTKPVSPSVAIPPQVGSGPSVGPTPPQVVVAPAVVQTVPGTPVNPPKPESSDPLHKGDDLKPDQVHAKIQLEALEDVVIHYQSDQQEKSSILLRKGRYLAVKAEKGLWIKTSEPEKLRFKLGTGGTFSALPHRQFKVDHQGLVTPMP